MSVISLSDGYSATVDDADAPWLSRHLWSARKGGSASLPLVYAFTRIAGKEVSMHRLIAGVGPRMMVDHIDRNPLNNTRSNLRPATNSQNQANRRQSVRKTSRYKGVFWRKDAGKWQAWIRRNRIGRSLGFYLSETEAALAYDRAAVEEWGEFARPNFPQQRSMTK